MSCILKTWQVIHQRTTMAHCQLPSHEIVSGEDLNESVWFRNHVCKMRQISTTREAVFSSLQSALILLGYNMPIPRLHLQASER
jgi:hypothetical protein